ncbi:MAG: hypothetical protein HC860_05940 [Alkalinema sp. RU_4_3]|nr:hypothetical protein [Alkalinema sp. RU_4_3]
MNQIELIEAQKNLPEIIADLMPGEGVEILQDDHPVARLVVGPKRVLRLEESEVLPVILDNGSEPHLEEDLEDFVDDEDVQYEQMPIKYSHTIEVTRNFVGEIPPQVYVWDDDD